MTRYFKAYVALLTVGFVMGLAVGIAATGLATAKDRIRATQADELSDMLGTVTEALQRANANRDQLRQSIADRDDLIDKQRRLINVVTAERDELLQRVANEKRQRDDQGSASGTMPHNPDFKGGSGWVALGNGEWLGIGDPEPSRKLEMIEASIIKSRR